MESMELTAKQIIQLLHNEKVQTEISGEKVELTADLSSEDLEDIAEAIGDLTEEDDIEEDEEDDDEEEVEEDDEEDDEDFDEDVEAAG